jgi:2-keto-4-pentenoate hydratase/2-oxohepta-3-ene-1,7-dioic acid hydratase in catechol pathway
MKIVRYQNQLGQIEYGALDASGKTFKLRGDIFDKPEITNEPASVAKLLAPVAPVTILGIGLNYRKHAAESGAKIPEYPVLFVKGLNTLQNPNDPIEIPTFLKSDEVDYECELAVVIGKRCKNVRRDDALKYVLGYTCGNDISARDWQRQKGGSQWCRGKFFDTFAPMGPCLVTPDEIPNPNSLQIKTILNGVAVQDWNTNDMIFDVPTLIEFLSGSTTLLPGTVIMTGTPHGVGMGKTPPVYLKPGDQVIVEIEKIGKLTNPVKLES